MNGLNGLDVNNIEHVSLFIDDTKNILNGLENLYYNWYWLRKNWQISLKEFKTVDTCKSARKELESDEAKLRRCSMQFIVFGSTSAGKSALINAIFMKNILPSHGGSTTNCFTEISRSLDDSNYFQYSDNNRKVSISLLSIIDESFELEMAELIESRFHVKVFLSAKEFRILAQDIVIVDTPGIDSSKDLDKRIKKQCTIADAIILVINSEIKFSEIEKKFLNDHLNEFSKLKLVIVYNRWDLIKERKDYYETENRKAANEYLHEILRNPMRSYDSDIFFLSSKERQMIQSKDSKVLSELNGEGHIGWEERNNSFDQFINYIENSSREKSDKRRIPIIQKDIDILNNTIDNLKLLKANLQKRILWKIKDCLSNYIDLENTLKKELQDIFNRKYEIFFYKCFKSIKKRKSDDNIDDLQYIVNETITVIAATYKLSIKESIKSQRNPRNGYLVQILDHFYFPLFDNILCTTNTEIVIELQKHFIEITRIHKKYKNISMVGVIALGGVALAACGAGAGIAAPIATAVAAPSFMAAGATVGGGMGGAATYFAHKMHEWKRTLYKPRYSEFEKPVLNFWQSYQDKFEKCFDEIKFRLSKTVEEKIMGSLEKDIKAIELKLNNLKGTWSY